MTMKFDVLVEVDPTKAVKTEISLGKLGGIFYMEAGGKKYTICKEVANTMSTAFKEFARTLK